MAKDVSLIRIKADTNDYERSIKQAQKTWDDFTKGLGVNVGKLTGVAAAIGAVTGTLKVAKDAFFQSESNIDEWGRVVKSSEAAYSTFLNTLNSGNWSNFFTNLSIAVQGARDLYDALDRLGSIKSNNAAAIAIVQQQIAQLRLAKQQGQNVDEQLKKATEQLRNLQNQSINAGMAAGNMAIRNTIKNRVNAENINGINISEGTFIQLAYQLEHEGQAVFDSMKKTFTDLKEKATVETSTSYTNQYGGTSYAKAYIVDINKLTAEEQKQYLIAKAITEGETEIQEGIAMFAQAIQEGTAAAREEFKGNRYALQGAGGSGSGSGSLTNKETYIPAIGSIDEMRAKVKELQDEFNKTADQSIRGQLLVAIDEAQKKLDFMSGKGLTPVSRYSGTLSDKLGIGFDTSKELKKIEGAEVEGNNRATDTTIQAIKENMNNVRDITSSVSGILNGIQNMGIEIPEEISRAFGILQTMSSVLTAILTITTLIKGEQEIQTGASIFKAIFPFAAGGVVRAAGGYEVPGNYGYDAVPALLSSGELVLNKSQQGVLAASLQDSAAGNRQTLLAKVKGTDLIVMLDRTGRMTGKGELAFWKD